MSVDQNFSSRKVLQTGGAAATSSSASPNSSPNKSGKRLSLKVLGRSNTSASKALHKSPVKRQQTINEASGGGGGGKGEKDLGEFIPCSSGPPGVDSVGESSPKATKIIQSWKSACKDKTKDLIRRWKTLPENNPEFDQIATGSGNCSPAGSSTNISVANSPSKDTRESSTMVNPGGSGGGGGSGIMGTPSKRGKKDQQERGESSGSIATGLQGLSLKTSPATTNGPVQDENKSSKGWSVHVWATYVQRDPVLDDDSSHDPSSPPRQHLSEFQKVKLTHFFRHVLDMNHDDVISAEDFVALNQRIRHYIDWSSECIEFHILKEVHSGFLECFLNQPLDEESDMYYCREGRETRSHVNIDEWLDVWGELLQGSRTMESLPLWLQYFPKILFQVVNKSGSGTISREELRAFYTTFLGIDFRVVNDTLDQVHSAMTDRSTQKFTYSLYKLCFANFLFGKYPHGPGQYMFGICGKESLDCPFPIDYSALNTAKDDLELYDPDREQRSNKEVNRRF